MNTKKESKEMRKAEIAKAIAAVQAEIENCTATVNEPRYIIAHRKLDEAQSRLKRLQVLQSGGPNRYTVHFPNRSGGFTRYESITVVGEGGVIVSGPVLVGGVRKLKCNLKDNRTGRWVRRDYTELSDWKKGIKVTYNDDGTSREEIWGQALREKAAQ